jgi:hypothetical protein
MKEAINRILAFCAGYISIIIVAHISLYEAIFNKNKNEK